MKLLSGYLPVVALSLSLSVPAGLFAQQPAQEEEANRPTLFERIEEESEGNVTFEIPQNIEDKIFTVPSSGPKKRVGTPRKHQQRGIIRKEGYRIQVFSDGRNQGSLQAKARARGNAVVSRFPKYRGQVYTFSSAPNWYTRVGNFSTQGEANAALSELKRAFPSFASEMRVVKCQIVLVR